MKSCLEKNINIIGKKLWVHCKILIALERNLLEQVELKKIDQAIKFAENQFGKISKDGLFRKQIENVFKKAKKPTVGTPAKKEATLVLLEKVLKH